jgi:tRNA (mo5U34)-methyltransferase
MSAAAEALVARSDIIWHQRFELMPGVFTPGVSDVALLLDACGLPDRLEGRSVLDVGTTNGGAAFALEARGAGNVVAVDIFGPETFGFAAAAELRGSRAEFLQASIYELPERLTQPFDIVLFWGVLYHLRHPLLGLDSLRAVTRGEAYVETAVADATLGDAAAEPLARFHRTDQLAGDSSNWFEPSIAAAAAWCSSAGLEPELLRTFPPEGPPTRAVFRAVPTEGHAEYRRLSYERPIRATIA